jgi:hypothetical protein
VGGHAGDLEAAVRRVEQIFSTENGRWGQLVIHEHSPASAPGVDGR